MEWTPRREQPGLAEPIGRFLPPSVERGGGEVDIFPIYTIVTTGCGWHLLFSYVPMQEEEEPSSKSKE